MDKRYIGTSFSSEFEKVNDEFLKCTVSVMSCDQIANGTKFTKESVDKALPTLNYAPVIGYFTDDFNGHAHELVWDDEGMKTVVKTIPYGVVIKDSARWQMMTKDNGEKENYLVCDVYLWSRYEEAVTKVKENKCNQSMEVICNGGNYKDSYFEVTDFNFSGLCILGKDVTPAFNLAKVRTTENFSQDNEEIKVEYQEMITALDRFLNFEKGGDEVEETIELEQELKEEEIVEETKEVETTYETEEIVETEEDFAKKKKCEDDECTCDEGEIDDDCPIHGDDSTEDIEEDMAKEETVDYQAKYDDLLIEYGKLEKEISEIKSEFEELKTYKETKESEIRLAKEKELFNQFSELKCIAEFEVLVNNAKDFTLDNLEKELYALLGKVKYSSKKLKKEEQKTLFNHVETAYEEKPKHCSKYADLIEQYKNK